MKRPFLSLTDAEWRSLCEMKKTWAWIMKNYEQPKWCGYPDALAGSMGCWSLTGRMVTGKKDCKGCDCLIKTSVVAPD